MGSSSATLAHILDLLDGLPLSSRRMFGEYALYLDGAVVALVCDDQLWIKPYAEARAALPDAPRGQPFPGATLYMNVTEYLDDPAPVMLALRAVARERPAPKPKKRRPAGDA